MNSFTLPAWLLTLVGAWVLSVEAGAAATLGLVAQWTLKAPAKVPDWVPPLAVALIAAVLWTFVLGNRPEDWKFTHAWFASFAMWAMSALGIASAAGHTGGAPKTNSL